MTKSDAIVLLPVPVNGAGYEYIPTPEGKGFSAEAISQIGHTLYNRFHFREGMMVYRDDRIGQTRKTVETRVREVIDSLQINGYQITRKPR